MRLFKRKFFRGYFELKMKYWMATHKRGDTQTIISSWEIALSVVSAWTSWHGPSQIRSSSPVVAWNFSRLLQSEQTLFPQKRQWCRRIKAVNFRLQRWQVALWIIGIPYFCNLAFELLAKMPEAWLPRRERTWNGIGKRSVNKQSIKVGF